MKRLKLYLLACVALLFWRAPLSAQTFAPEPPATDGFQFVSNSGLDTNSGLAPGDAKLTVSGACAALPSGNSGCTAGSGVIFLAPSFSGTIPTITAAGISVSRAAFNGAFATYSSAHTLSISDSWVNVTGATTITAPHALVGQKWTVFNAGSNTVTLKADSGNINATATVTLTPTQGAQVNCDGTNCWAATPAAFSTFSNRTTVNLAANYGVTVGANPLSIGLGTGALTASHLGSFFITFTCEQQTATANDPMACRLFRTTGTVPSQGSSCAGDSPLTLAAQSPGSINGLWQSGAYWDSSVGTSTAYKYYLCVDNFNTGNSVTTFGDGTQLRTTLTVNEQ